MAIDFNASPYFDDFNESNQFYKILFKPGFAVQSRELNQIQSILQNQITKFGDHVFKHGSVVIPGNSFAELNTPYIKISSYSDSDLTESDFEGKIIEGSQSGIKAIVKKAIASDSPDPITFYLSYISGNSNGDVEFLAGETVFVVDNISTEATISSSSHKGFGSIASVNNGIYYVNGYFATVLKQTVILSKYSNTPSGHVVLKITEELIDSESDESLLDPALGSSNYFAPGADRFKITLTLDVLELGTTLTDDYIELMRYRDGELEEHSRYPKYSELEKTLARRTFDESGNYIVDGFVPEIREHLKEERNNGVYESGNINKLVVQVSPGKGYISGFEIDRPARTRIEIDKARTSEHIKETETILRPDYGQYILISDINGFFSIKERQTVNLYNDNDNANANANIIGSAKVMGIDYVSTLSVSANIYKLWLSEVNISSNYSIEDAGGIRYGTNNYAYVMTEYLAPVSSGSFAVGENIEHSSGRKAKIQYYDSTSGKLYAYKHDHSNTTPRIGDLVVGSSTSTESYLTNKKVLTTSTQSSLIFEMPIEVANTLKNNSLQYDLEYTVQKELTIVTDTLGVGSVTISSGVIDPIEDGTFIAIQNTGIVPISLFDLNLSGDTLSFDGNVAYASKTIKVYCNVTKTDVNPKTKTLTQTNEVFVSPGSIVTLSKYDIVELVSVIDSVGDITQNYDMFSGQSDYIYNRGSIRLKASKPAPVGNITVTYKYYEHSISGDFFCVDSYSSIPNYLSLNNEYVSSSTNKTYQLSNCIDFRPSVGSDGTMSGTGNRQNDLIVQETVFRTNLKYYIPRYDSLVIDASSILSVIKGIPNETPRLPVVPLDKFEIARFFIPPYTKTADSVIVELLETQRYTMKDINRLEQRTKQLENFILLTTDEQAINNITVIDADTGLDRFKTGFMVEDFSQPLIKAFTTHEDFSASFNNGILSPLIESINVPLSLLPDSDHYIFENDFILLPYYEEAFIQQKLSSRLLNVNPFLIIKWDGLLNIIPPEDNFVDMRDLPIKYETKTEEVSVSEHSDSPDRNTIPDRGALYGDNWIPVQQKVSKDSTATVIVTGNFGSQAIGLGNKLVRMAGIVTFSPGVAMTLRYQGTNAGYGAGDITAFFTGVVNGIQQYSYQGEIVGIAYKKDDVATSQKISNTIRNTDLNPSFNNSFAHKGKAR